jgi:phage baseplate assembly protein V
MSNLVYLPPSRIRIDGREYAQTNLAAIPAIRVHQRLSMPAQCELVFVYSEGERTSSQDVALGSELTIDFRNDGRPLFKGDVTAVEYDYGERCEFRIRAYDRLHVLRKTQRVETHVNVTCISLAAELTKKLGIKVANRTTVPNRKWVLQHRQTDLDFLVEFALDYGLYLRLDDDTLNFVRLEGTGDPVVLRLAENLLQARIEMNSDSATNVVNARGWNITARTGAEVKSSAVSRDAWQRTTSNGGPRKFNLPDDHYLLDELNDDLNFLAQSELDRRMARERTIVGVATGDPALRPGTRIDVQNVKNSLEGVYVLTDVVHNIDMQNGYTTQFSTKPPPAPKKSRGTIITLGIVTYVHRETAKIKAILPGYGDRIETDWMDIVVVGAGNGKGLVVMPQPDDRVLVLLPHEDPSKGIVLGGLYSQKLTPPGSGKHKFTWPYIVQTAAGHTIILDDETGKIRFQNVDGSYLDLSPESVHLHAKQDLTIEAPGRSIAIRGKQIDFEEV